jgi:antitoxin component YwqK of YwqJK toxin-antitoxin module
MIRKVETSYDGSSVIEHTRLYYDDGKLKQEKYEKDGQEYGLYTAFNKDGVLVMSVEYSDGEYNGDYRYFFDDGSLKELTTYSEGKKEGPALSYYSNEGHPLEYSGSYKNNERDGKWETYTVEGTRKSIMNYKEGVFDGEYKTFATGNTSSSSIHVFGQYSSGKRTGEWLYGYNNEGWVEKVYYENDIKVWMEKVDSNIRTYYKPDGSVDHTESKP